MKSGADVGAAGTQSVPDANGHIGHHKHGVPHGLNGHIDAAGDNSKARGRHAGGLSNPVAQGNDARHKGDDPHHYPGDGAGQQGRIEAVLCRRSRKGCPRTHGKCGSMDLFLKSGLSFQPVLNGLSYVESQHNAIVNAQSGGSCHDNGLNHRPIINDCGANIEQHPQQCSANSGNHAKGPQCTADNFIKLLTVCNGIELSKYWR